MYQLLKEDNRGYTLMESLLHLVIFAIFAQLFLLFFLWKEPIERHHMDKTNTAWELFALDLQADLVDIRTFALHDDRQGLQVRNGHDELIDIERTNNVIRRRKDGEGHVPLLTEMHSVHFTESGEYLHVEVTLQDGTRKERSFAIGYNPE